MTDSLGRNSNELHIFVAFWIFFIVRCQLATIIKKIDTWDILFDYFRNILHSFIVQKIFKIQIPLQFQSDILTNFRMNLFVLLTIVFMWMFHYETVIKNNSNHRTVIITNEKEGVVLFPFTLWQINSLFLWLYIQIITMSY